MNQDQSLQHVPMGADEKPALKGESLSVSEGIPMPIPPPRHFPPATEQGILQAGNLTQQEIANL